jgi:hypothetical protein
MALLSDFFIASTNEIQSLNILQSPGKTFPAVQARAIELVKITKLQCIIDGSVFNDHIKDLDGMIVRSAGDDGPWIILLPNIITKTLLESNETKLADIGKSWAVTEEWVLDGGKPENIIPLIKNLTNLAKKAQAEKRSIYLWVSL